MKPIVLCRLDELPDGGARLMTVPGAPVNGLVVLRSANAVHAFVNRCPHFGAPLAQRQEHLIYQPHASLSCNNHYARFRWNDGYCEFGDCQGEFLEPVELEVIDDTVCLTGKIN